MITLEDDALDFSFPEVHPRAELRVEFQRTLRIPDDRTDHRLPPGLGRFPVRHVDDFAGRAPERWLTRGGVMLPMYRSEAMWLNFRPQHHRRGAYPFAVKVAAGKINAVTGEATHGGVQLIAYPMKREVYERKVEREVEDPLMARSVDLEMAPSASAAPNMGLGAGSRMRQEIYDDPYDFDDWDLRRASRCFVPLTNVLVWRAITGAEPPTTPPTAKEYTEAGLPWFDYYAADREAVEGSERQRRVKSVLEIGEEEGEPALPENESVEPTNVVELRNELGADQVREGRF